jgi:membrane protease YdiL (CAAX protease family)
MPIRARSLLAIVFLSGLVSTFVVEGIWPEWTSEDCWADIAYTVIWLCTMTCAVVLIVSHSHLSISSVFGKVLSVSEVAKLAHLSFLVAAVSLGAIWFVFLPLSYVTPGFVQFWLIDDPTVFIWREAPLVAIANILNLVLNVVVVPLVEEFTFRGLLLNRWAAKWGVPRAILFSSLVFGFLHTDILGGVFFGFVAAVLYVKTRSLLAPIAFHAGNNLLVWLFALGETIFKEPTAEYTLQQFRAEWWMGALGLAIGLPWAVNFARKNWPDSSWQTPLQRRFQVSAQIPK